MNTLGVVFSAEFVRRIKSRPFMLGTLLGAATVLLLAILPSMLGGALSSAAKRVVLVGEPALTAKAAARLAKDFDITERLPKLDAPPTTAFLNKHGNASAIAVLTQAKDGLRVVAYTRDPSAFRSAFGRDLAPIDLAIATGASADVIARHMTVPVDIRDVEGRFANANAADAAKGIAYLFVMLLYVAILLNTQQLLASVAEEKTSRIAEQLVAMIDPTQLLAAKILASAATGFIQLAVWITTGLVAGRAVTGIFARDGAPSDMPMLGMLTISSTEILAFIAFFIVGFAQYAVLYAAAGSLINRTEDVGAVSGPLVVPVVLGIVLAQFGLAFPNSPNVVTFSMVPLISPFVMFTRIAVSTVPAWQIALSLVLNVATAIVLAWAAGKVYRVGLLLYGRAPSLRQVIATLRA